MTFGTHRYLIALVLLAGGAHAAPANDIVIGQTADLSSVTGVQMHHFNAGAQLALETANERGGVNGRRIRLQTIDDGYVAATAAKNAETLAADPSVVAFFGTRGSDPTDAVIKVAERERISLIAPVNGADAVRESKFVFPVRASYKSEVETILRHFSVAQVSLAVLVQDDKFGQPLYAYVQERLKAPSLSSIRLAGAVVFDRKAKSLDASAEKILALKPSVVIAICNPTACTDFVAALHKRTESTKEQRPRIAHLSNADMLAEFKAVGGAGLVGSPFAQVMPDPRWSRLAITREFAGVAGRAGVELNYRTFEGYVSALVLVEGLKRAKTMTREGVREGFEALGTLNLGGISLEYTSTKRTGSSYVGLVSLDATGRLLH